MSANHRPPSGPVVACMLLLILMRTRLRRRPLSGTDDDAVLDSNQPAAQTRQAEDVGASEGRRARARAMAIGEALLPVENQGDNNDIDF